MRYKQSDGGRAIAGFRGKNVGDCVTRAIAIATGQPYRRTYNELRELSIEMTGGLEKAGPDGVESAVSHRYLTEIGFELTLVKGKHLKDLEVSPLPTVVVTSNHMMTVVNDVLYDAWDSRKSNRTNNGSPKIVGFYRRTR